MGECLNGQAPPRVDARVVVDGQAWLCVCRSDTACVMTLTDLSRAVSERYQETSRDTFAELAADSHGQTVLR